MYALDDIKIIPTQQRQALPFARDAVEEVLDGRFTSTTFMFTWMNAPFPSLWPNNQLGHPMTKEQINFLKWLLKYPIVDSGEDE